MINQRLKEIRLDLGITAGEFASILNEKEQRIRDIENNRMKNLPLDFLNNFIYNLPKYSLEWLISGNGKMTKDESGAWVEVAKDGIEAFNKINEILDMDVIKEQNKKNTIPMPALKYLIEYVYKFGYNRDQIINMLAFGFACIEYSLEKKGD